MTKCYPSVVHSILSHFAICFRESPRMQYAVGVSRTKGGGGRKHVTKRSTHARPGMHMQQCSAVPLRSTL